jgi:GH18 family chitinase
MKLGFKTSALIYTLFSIVAAQSDLDEYCPDETPSLPPGHQQKVFTAWFAGWHEDQYTLKDVPWSKYTHLTYAFA